MTSSDRPQPLEVDLTYNFRDVGGYRVPGGAVRTGALYRSDALAQLSDDGRRTLNRLGVGSVIDLRDGQERGSAPDALGEGAIEYLAQPIFEHSWIFADGPVTLEGLYTAMVERYSTALVEAVTAVATRGSAPVVVHCTAGKDRTGLVVALILTSIGVDRDDVLRDYELTQANLEGDWLAGMLQRVRAVGVADSPDLRRLLAGSPVELLAGTLAGIDRHHGSVEAYLLRHGARREHLDALRDRLVESAPQG